MKRITEGIINAGGTYIEELAEVMSEYDCELVELEINIILKLLNT